MAAAADEMDVDELLLLSAHHSDLAAARAAAADLDLAFSLQMEEALAASAALNPNPAPEVAPATATAVDLVSGGSDDVVAAIDVQAEELDRAQQLLDLHRVAISHEIAAHDAAFAREIAEMDDDEWDSIGNWVEKPFNPSDPDAVARPFKLYFTGGSETRGTRTVTAIAAVLMGPGGETVLTMKKPAAIGETSKEMLSAYALLEGLNAALALGVQRIELVFDMMALYMHVKGHWQCKQRKVLVVIDQVLMRQRKFTTCIMSLSPRNQCTFVIRIVQDVIISQFSKADEPRFSTNIDEMCKICLEYTNSSQMVVIENCMHHFCRSCMEQHAEVKLLHGTLPNCPHEGCNVKLSVEFSRKFLTAKLLDIMIDRVKEESIPPTEKIYCPYPKCSALMALNEAICPASSQASSSRHPAVYNVALRRCIKCAGLFCMNCKVPWHDNMSCFDYKLMFPNPSEEEALLNRLAGQHLWKRCVKCNHMIELSTGCNHVTCKCGHEFCYNCGREWREKRATCQCPLWDERNIIDDDAGDSDDEGYAAPAQRQVHHRQPYHRRQYNRRPQ